jgi:tRNA (guanine37-N1)-methyltransferase
MAKECVCVKVPKSLGEKTIVLASKLKIMNNELTIQRNTAFICIPLARKPSKSEAKAFMQQIPELEFSVHTFPERKKHGATFAELLEDKLAAHLLASLPRAVDLVGDIAIIEIPLELDSYKSVIGEAVLKAHKHVRTVLAKAGAVSGTYRLREFSVIAGEPKTETLHKEYGCKYHVDVAKAYFSPRLSNEHRRVATLVKDGETVVDMFAGVGPFSIQIAEMRKNVKVHAVDMNPDAVELLKKNIRLNRVESKVDPILGDARQVVKEMLSDAANRVIMNLPEKAMEFVDVACMALKPKGGIVHFYSFVNASDPLEKMQLRFAENVENYGRKIEKILFSKGVRETAPYEWQAVLDAEIR